MISDYVIRNNISNNVISNQSWLAWLDVINFELFGITAIDQSNTQWSNVLLHQRVVNFCIPLFYKKFDGFYWGTSCCKHFFAVVLHNWCVIFTFVKVFYTNVKVIFTNETVIFTDVKTFYGRFSERRKYKIGQKLNKTSEQKFYDITHISRNISLW